MGNYITDCIVTNGSTGTLKQFRVCEADVDQHGNFIRIGSVAHLEYTEGNDFVFVRNAYGEFSYERIAHTPFVTPALPSKENTAKVLKLNEGLMALISAAQNGSSPTDFNGTLNGVL